MFFFDPTALRIGMQVNSDSAMPFCTLVLTSLNFGEAWFCDLGFNHFMQYNSNNLRRRGGGFTSLAFTSSIMAMLPYSEHEEDKSRPRRKSMDVPLDNHTFVKPIKQCFVKNPRLMPMTRIMLALLSGWAGNGDPIETTTGIIAKHLRRCRRQVFRYLKDAVEEGYLYYSRTKDRAGRYTGLKIGLNFSAIRFTNTWKPKTNRKPAEPLAMTLKSDTNDKHIYNTKRDDEIWKSLLSFGESLGYFEKKEKSL